MKCKARRLNAAGSPPPNSCLLSVRLLISSSFFSGTSGNEKGRAGFSLDEGGKRWLSAENQPHGEEGAGNDCDRSEWSPGLQPLRHRRGGGGRRRFSSRRFLFSFSAHFSRFSCKFWLQLHSRTKHEKHDVALKASDTAGLCKHTTFFPLFFSPSLFSCCEQRLLSVTPPPPGAVHCLTLLSPRLLFSRSIFFFLLCL